MSLSGFFYFSCFISKQAMKRAIKLEPNNKSKLPRMSNNVDENKVWCQISLIIYIHYSKYFYFILSPKGEVPQNLTEGSHCLETLFLTLLDFFFSPPLRPIPKRPTYPPKESSLEPRRGVPLFGDAFSYFIRKKNFTPPTTHSKTPYLFPKGELP